MSINPLRHGMLHSENKSVFDSAITITEQFTVSTFATSASGSLKNPSDPARIGLGRRPRNLWNISERFVSVGCEGPEWVNLTQSDPFEKPPLFYIVNTGVNAAGIEQFPYAVVITGYNQEVAERVKASLDSMRERGIPIL